MKIHQFFSIVAIIAAILFLAAVSAPTASFAAGNSKQTGVKASKSKTAHKNIVRYAKASNGGFKQQRVARKSNTLKEPSCVQCWTNTTSNWGTAASSGYGTQNNPNVVCSTCVPAWNLPATASRAPAKSSSNRSVKSASNRTSNSSATCATCAPCGPVSVWNAPATSGPAITYTPPPAQPAPPAPSATPATQRLNSCGGLLCSVLQVPYAVLQVPYNIAAFVFGSCPTGGCS